VELAAGSPQIRTISGSQSVMVRTNVVLSASVFGGLPMGIQWYKDGSLFPGATNLSLTLFSVLPSDSGNYTLVASNSGGSVTSAPIVLAVIPVPPSIVWQPKDQFVLLNDNADFCVAIAGSQPIRYQWRWDGRDIPGAIASSFSIPAASLTNAGTYSVVATNDYGAVTSRIASLFLFKTLPPRRVFAWGDNSAAQTSLPDGLSNVVDIVARGLISAARKSNGTIAVWGGAGYSSLSNVPPGLTNIAAISVSDTHILALRSNGTVVAWGINSYGQTIVPDNLSAVTAVASGECHSMALKSDGGVVVWGDSSNSKWYPFMTAITRRRSG
jgi:hypothetical protein